MLEGLKVTVITQLQYTTSDGATFDSVHVAIQRELKLYVDKVLKENNVDSEDVDKVIDFITGNFGVFQHIRRQIIDSFNKLAAQVEQPGVL